MALNSAPIVSVGSCDPGSHVVSHFSNTGDWVRVYCPGAGIVSTLPVTFDGCAQAGVRAQPQNDPVRGTVDMDDFSGGFGMWNGTSFSAPLFVGRLAQKLVEKPTLSLSPDDKAAQAWAIVDDLCQTRGLK